MKKFVAFALTVSLAFSMFLLPAHASVAYEDVTMIPVYATDGTVIDSIIRDENGNLSFSFAHFAEKILHAGTIDGGHVAQSHVWQVKYGEQLNLSLFSYWKDDFDLQLYYDHLTGRSTLCVMADQRMLRVDGYLADTANAVHDGVTDLYVSEALARVAIQTAYAADCDTAIAALEASGIEYAVFDFSLPRLATGN